MNRIFIKPTPPSKPEAGKEPLPELKVRKPVNGYLNPEGEWVNAEGYWLRRIADGDVVQDEDAVEPAEPAPVVTEAAKEAAATKTAVAESTSKTRR